MHIFVQVILFLQQNFGHFIMHTHTPRFRTYYNNKWKFENGFRFSKCSELLTKLDRESLPQRCMDVSIKLCIKQMDFNRKWAKLFIHHLTYKFVPARVCACMCRWIWGYVYVNLFRCGMIKTLDILVLGNLLW